MIGFLSWTFLLQTNNKILNSHSEVALKPNICIVTVFEIETYILINSGEGPDAKGFANCGNQYLAKSGIDKPFYFCQDLTCLKRLSHHFAKNKLG